MKKQEEMLNENFKDGVVPKKPLIIGKSKEVCLIKNFVKIYLKLKNQKFDSGTYFSSLNKQKDDKDKD